MKYILSVSEINRYIKEVMSNDIILSNLWIKGEVSNYKSHSSGHMYFTIKDEKALLKCVMFRTQASLLRFTPENGMKVIIKGYVSVFERDGQYQLYAEEMQPDGIGNLHVAYEQLKKKLEDEGLFDNKKKKKIPYLPDSIGVITSPTGSVIKDIINVSSRRYNNIQIKIFPVAVQGESAPKQIAYAINKLNEFKKVDVIILARGGGSLEELWAFNEEVVARSIYASEIPIISAVGHETDYTISDFVADLRAPTPSAAAELVVPEKTLLKEKINTKNKQLLYAAQKNINLNKLKYQRLINSRALKQPYDKVYQERMRLDVLNKYLNRALLNNKDREKAKVSLLVGKLDMLSPLSILSRGYGIVRYKSDGRLVKSTEGIKKGDEIEIGLKDGTVECIVK